MGLNSIRFDLSDWLIHFFRPFNRSSPDAPLLPQHMGLNNTDEGINISALFMLRCAIRQGRLWATWSFRNDIRTIYGPDPAVCFTEMPLAAFLEAGKQRARRGEAMSQYALMFPKNAMFSIGANPVIYGLDNRTARPPLGKGGGPRIFQDDVLPKNEQYRYVTFNPSSMKPVDWTHEREWRWPCRDGSAEIERQLNEYGGVSDAADMPGLDICSGNLRGMGIVVKTKKEARLVLYDILSLVDRGVIGQWHYSFILCAQGLTNFSDLRDPKEVAKAIRQGMIDLEPYFCYPLEQLENLAARFSDIVSEVEHSSPEDEAGEVGGCWLWLLENSHPLTRALLAANRVTVSREGRYLVFPAEFSDGRSLRQRETMTKQLAKRIKAEFRVKCGYYSVAGSNYPDDIPSYTDIVDDAMFYNQT